MTIFGSGKFAFMLAHKRTGDNAGDIIRFCCFKSYFTKFIQAFQSKMFFMAGNLQHAVGGSVKNRLTGFQVFFAKFFYNNRAGRGNITQYTVNTAFSTDFSNQFRRKRRIIRLKIAPVKQHGSSGHFPVSGSCVLTFADFFGMTKFMTYCKRRLVLAM